MNLRERCYTVPGRIYTEDDLDYESILLAKVREIASKPLENDSLSSKSDSESRPPPIPLRLTKSPGRLNQPRWQCDSKSSEKPLFTEPVKEDSQYENSESSEDMSESERVIRGIIRERKTNQLLSQQAMTQSVDHRNWEAEKTKAYHGLKASFSTVRKAIIDNRQKKEQKRLQVKRDLRKLIENHPNFPEKVVRMAGHCRWKTQDYEIADDEDSSFLSTEAYDRIQTIPQFHEAGRLVGTLQRRNRSVSTYMKEGKTAEEPENNIKSRKARLKSALSQLLPHSLSLQVSLSRLLDSSSSDLLLVLQAIGRTLAFLGLYERCGDTTGLRRLFSPYALPQVIQQEQVVTHYEFDNENEVFIPLLLGRNHESSDAVSIEFTQKCVS